VTTRSEFFTLRDLYRAFFSIPIDNANQYLSAAIWEGRRCTRTVMTQGFTQSPAFFFFLPHPRHAEVPGRHSSDNTGSITHWATRELPPKSFLLLTNQESWCRWYKLFQMLSFVTMFRQLASLSPSFPGLFFFFFSPGRQHIHLLKILASKGQNVSKGKLRFV